ncbi:MAG: hypothetical protein QM674_04990 [Burkholderiaceae bacterium]
MAGSEALPLLGTAMNLRLSAPVSRDPVITERRASPQRVGDDRAGPVRRRYLQLLTWSFTLFSTVRLVAYLPTIIALVQSGDSSQHSLWTWGIWLGANATMAAWLYESNGQRVDRTVVVNIGNAMMCLLTCVVIIWYRR